VSLVSFFLLFYIFAFIFPLYDFLHVGSVNWISDHGSAIDDVSEEWIRVFSSKIVKRVKQGLY
jgi:hypothetical protein